MSVENHVALLFIDEERDRVSFASLGLPIGFDEERLLVNVPKIRSVLKVAGLGGVEVVGAEGRRPEDDFSANLNADGSATVGLSLQPKDVPTKGEVSLSEPAPGIIFNTYYRPVSQVKINTISRDEYLRKSKYRKGQLDPNGHAKHLSGAISSGLDVGSVLRHQQTVSPAHRGFIGGVVIYAAATDAIEMFVRAGESPSLPVMLGALGAVSLIKEKMWTILDQTSLSETFPSMAVGWDRRLLAQAIAKTSNFVTVAK